MSDDVNKDIQKAIQDAKGIGSGGFSQRPPVGLKPRYIHDGERIDEILRAIERYTDANMSIPKSWVDELRSLIGVHLK